MENNLSKGKLAVVLSKIEGFPTADVKKEQYTTDSEIAAEILTNILVDFADKVVVDLGAGTGILGIGALLSGAKEAILVEQDAEALAVAEKNYAQVKNEFSIGKATFVNKDIVEFCDNADIVVMNPPFGTKQEHADKKFLEKAFAIATTVYSFHKTTTRKFVEAVARDNGFRITHTWNFQFPLKATMKFHEKRIKRIEVTAYRLQRV
ncbi:methyltransferase [Candidatus Woesearchaeota archaeon]|nr:methyltransferase [Candidatus Woesearchaeota archaeon]